MEGRRPSTDQLHCDWRPRLQPRTKASHYIGVSYHKANRKWEAGIKVNGRQRYLGTFRDEVAAAKAYNDYVIAHNLNRPLNNLWSTPTIVEIFVSATERKELDYA
jgi:hypothetical protein